MITTELIIAIATFAFVTSATPGPNNIMLTASGANFGVKRTMPHILGIITGMALLNFSVGLGLGALFVELPILQDVLRVLGSAYLIWLALQLLKFSALKTADGEGGKPFSFTQAVLFQAINPKAWMMVVSANASFALAGQDYWLSVALIIALYITIGFPSIMMWAGFGQHIKQYLNNASSIKRFNIFMALLTMSCVVLIWLG